MSIVESITNPIYVTQSGDEIDCMVKFDTMPFAVPFTANKNDTEPHGREIYAALIAGQYGPIAAYVPPAPPPKPVDASPSTGPKVIA